MNFRFITTTVCVAALSTVALADNATGVKHKLGGEARTRFVFIDNNGLTDTLATEACQNRFRLDIDAMPTDSLQVRVSPIFIHTFGNAGAATGGTFTAKEAWMAWMPSDMWGLYV